jgi:hypothetical protein
MEFAIGQEESAGEVVRQADAGDVAGFGAERLVGGDDG